MSHGYRVVEERDAENEKKDVIFDCVVIGAGVTGLSAAFALQNTLTLLDGQHAVPQRSVLVVDSCDRVGGLVGTKLLKADGSEIVPAGDDLTSTPHDYLVELGPNSFQPTPRLLGLLRAIGIEDRIITSDPSAPRFLLHEDKLVTLPMSLKSFFLNFPTVDLKSKVKVILGLFGWRPSPPGTEESIGAFIDRLAGGSRFRECLLQPFMSGVYAGDAMRLSGDVVLGGLAAEDREEGGVFISLLKGSKARSGPLSVSYSADAGVGADSRPAVATRAPLESKEVTDIIHTFCPDLPQGELSIRRGSLCSFKMGMMTLPLALEKWLQKNSVASTTIVEQPNNAAPPPPPPTESEQGADGAAEKETSPFHGSGSRVRTEVRLRTRVTSVSWCPTENLWNIVVETNSPTTRVTPPRTDDTNVHQKHEPSIAATQKEIKARALLSTLPAYAASKLFGPLSASLGDQLDSIEYPSIAAVAVAVKASALNRLSPPCQAAAAAAHELAIDESIRKVIATFEDDRSSEEKTLLDVLSTKKEHDTRQQIGRLLSCASNIRGFGQLLTDFNSSTMKQPDGGGHSACASRNNNNNNNKVIGAIYASSLFPLNRTPVWREAEVLKRLNAERAEHTGPPVGGDDCLMPPHSSSNSSPYPSLSPLLPEVFAGEVQDGIDSSSKEEILLCFLGGARHASVARMSESELFGEVCQFFTHKDSVVQDVKGIRLLASKVLEQSIPQPLIGHQARVRSILDAVRNIPAVTTPNAAVGNVTDREDVSAGSGGGGGSDHCFCPLVLCGTWRDGVSVGDCVHAGIRRGVELARELLKQ